MVLNMKPFVLVGNPDMPRLTYSGCKSTCKESLDIFKNVKILGSSPLGFGFG
jgi:hypothetical protein